MTMHLKIEIGGGEGGRDIGIARSGFKESEWMGGISDRGGGQGIGFLVLQSGGGGGYGNQAYCGESFNYRAMAGGGLFVKVSVFRRP